MHENLRYTFKMVYIVYVLYNSISLFNQSNAVLFEVTVLGSAVFCCPANEKEALL